jgi:branched-chain amino acid transport system ATP-binding protein
MLEITQLNAFYGPAQALFDVNLTVASGECVVLQGLNGAGKSTLLKSIIGLDVRSTGKLLYGAGGARNDISRWETHRRAQAGIGYVAEDRRLFAGLTVHENLRVAAGRNARALEASALDLFPALKTMLTRPAAHMSGGEQQMLAIARTLMLEPKLLLLDEPCEGIAPVLVEAIQRALAVLQRQGMTLLIAEQNRVLARSADCLLTLVAGKVTH